MIKVIARTREHEPTFTHPETKTGEVFFANASAHAFATMRFSTKRIGNVAYDGEGKQLSAKDWCPVFVQEAELLSLDQTLSELRTKDREGR